MSGVRKINIKNGMYYFSDHIIRIKNLDPNNIKTEKKPYKNILTCYIIYYIHLRYVTPNSAKPLTSYQQRKRMKKIMEICIWHQFLMMKAKTSWKSIKKYGEKLRLDSHVPEDLIFSPAFFKKITILCLTF